MTWFNGWWRLWVTCSVVMAAVIVTHIYPRLPSEESIAKMHERDIKEIETILGYKRNPSTIPPGFDMGDWAQYSIDDVVSGRIRVDASFEYDLTHLKGNRAMAFGRLALLCGAASLILLFLGYVVAWVRKGFRPNEKWTS